jgi:hypothetical protein
MNSDAHSTEAMKKSSILKWHKWFKQILKLEHDKNVFIQKCTNWLNTETVWNTVFQKTCNNQACLLCRNTDEVCEVCVQNGLNFATTNGSSIMTTPQFTRCRQSFYGSGGGPSVALEHHPYSAILLPVTFWLFPKLKSTCKGCRFLEIKDFRNLWQQCWNFSEMFSYEHSYLRRLLWRWPLSLSCKPYRNICNKIMSLLVLEAKKDHYKPYQKFAAKCHQLVPVYLTTHNLLPISS